RNPPDGLAPLIAPVEHLASLLESDAPYSHLREAALAAVDRYEWPSPDTSAGDEGPVIDPAILAAVERLRSAVDAMDVLNGNGEPDQGRPRAGRAGLPAGGHGQPPRATARPGPAWSFGQQEQLPRRAPRAEIIVGTGGVGERVGAADPDREPAFRDPGEQITRPPQQLIPAGDVVDHRGAGEVHGAGAGEALELQPGYRPARPAGQHHHAAPADRPQAGGEGGPAHPPLDHRPPLPPRGPPPPPPAPPR